VSRRKIPWIILGVVLVLAAAGGAYYYFKVRPEQQARAAAAQAPAIATGAVTRGDLMLSASGSGTLVPARELAVAFESGGRLKEVLVNLGDVVEAGQTLAVLDDTDLVNAVAGAEINLRLAEISLETLTESADASDVAAAQASVASARDSLAKLTAAPDSQALLAARESLKSAQKQLDDLLAGPDPGEVKTARYALENAKNSLWSQQVSRDASCSGNDHVKCDQAQAAVGNADAAVRKAQEDLDAALAGPTADEISDARAKVASAKSSLNSLLEKPSADELAAAEAQVAVAQSNLETLQAGATPAELEKATLSVQQARMSLDTARRNLAQATLIAPMVGTVTALTAQAGDTVGSTSFITLSDLAQPQLKFWVEETDMASAAPGNAVNIVFEALPDYTFPGVILSVEPVLVTESNTTAVQALAGVDLSAHPFKVLSGMNAEVEVVAGEARNALLVPIEALRELAADQYAVFVIRPDGQQVLRPVRVGLKDLVNAEIISGLQEGEIVSLGTVQKTATSSQTAGGQQGQQGFPSGGPGIMIFEGGPGGGGPGGAR
jgi:HlyD family secretion protein